MDVSLVIKQRLSELGLDQRDLATAARVTDSYISQLLSRKKAPPAPGRTDLYDRIGELLKLPGGELARLAEEQRREMQRQRVADPPRPLYRECRELVLAKCAPARQAELRNIFSREPFGEFERLVTQKLLDVAQGVAREELRNEVWLRVMAQLAGTSYEQVRVAVLEFLDSDALNVSMESCVSFLDPIIDRWDIDPRSFAMEVVLNRRLAPACLKRFEFTERKVADELATEPGLEQFLRDDTLRGDATEAEIEFLRSLRFAGRHPSALYYYRELQSLRDPLHFTGATKLGPAR